MNVNAKETAKEIITEYYMLGLTKKQAIECAIINIQRVLDCNPTWVIDPLRSTVKYWERVMDELQAEKRKTTNKKMIVNKKIKRRYNYLVEKLGYDPVDYGFQFRYIINGKAISMDKQIEGNTIIFDFNYGKKNTWSLIAKNNYDALIFFTNQLPTKKEFESVIENLSETS